MRKALLILLALAPALSGCATDPNKFATGPYALVSGHLGVSAPFDQSSAVIVAIDGVPYFDDEEERRLTPGPHTITVRTNRGRQRTNKHEPRFESSKSAIATTTPGPSDVPWVSLNAEPCVRYYVIAHHTSGLVDSPWKAELAGSEPIKGCTREEPKQ